ncbi:hypothetical protein [Methylocella sp.]|uniref:hypothetical protein n=1 Tax=Methylocella sp. TaxID=1978226 RepID=UPI003784CF37
MQAFDPSDLSKTRLPIVVPFLTMCALGAVQLYFGASAAVVALAIFGVTVSFIPLHIFGCEIYSLFALVFGLRFLLVGILFKTLYGQPLDSHLFNPTPAYAMATLVVCLGVVVLMIARRFDPRTDFFAFPLDLAGLRKLAIGAFCFGLVCMAIVSMKDKSGAGGGNAGPLMVAATTLASLAVLGFVAEALRAVLASGGRTVMSPFLAGMFGVVLLAVLSLNMRGFLVDCLLGVALVGIIYRAINLRLIVAATLFALFFLNFMTPLTLYMRGNKELPPAAFAELMINTGARMAVDSDFRKVIVNTTTLAKAQREDDDIDYDYYGNRANVENRLSFVALIDAVMNGMKGHAFVGMSAVEKAMSAIMPGFLGFTKEAVSTGDWISWRIGLLEYPYISYLVIGVPMEAYAAWGLPGVLIYPFLFYLPVFLLLARFASLRSATPVSIFILASFQAEIAESTSDGMLNVLFRVAPVLFLSLLLLRVMLFPRLKRRSPMARMRRRSEISSVEI